ncbi:hypothetical protein EI555_005492 [Monodon monoceros]|uniref:Ig-like domain-containing protein n=1 Tax=Monodon monoceros TaxID=40151 RepID=A0A4U1FDI9_MONMO|nr:hypothetical protein EI555_005492 [Monodon monoceros]
MKSALKAPGPPHNSSSIAKLPLRLCVVEDKNSKVAWLNRSGIIFAGHDKWSLDPRVELEKRHSLEYSLRIQKVDVYDEGSYTCSVQTQHEPKTSQVYLIVQVPPKISNISSDVTVNEGSNVTLVCMANGRPEPVITWRHLTPTGAQTSIFKTLEQEDQQPQQQKKSFDPGESRNSVNHQYIALAHLLALINYSCHGK